MGDFDYSTDSLPEWEQERRADSWELQREGEERTPDDFAEIKAKIEKAQGIMAWSNDEMPFVEKAMHSLQLLVEAMAVYSRLTRSDFLRGLMESMRSADLAVAMTAAAEGDENALDFVQREGKRLLLELGLPSETVDEALIVPVSMEELQGLLGRAGDFNADDSNADDDETESNDGLNERKSVDNLLNRD